MKVALINAPYSGVLLPPNSPRRRVPPLGLLYLKSAVSDLAEARVFDGELYPSLQALLEAVRAFAPDLAGVSTYAATYPLAAHLARALRGRCTVVAGGPYATARDRDTLRDFDLVVRGEGEHTLRELVQGRRPEEIAGLSLLRGDRLLRTPDRPLEQDLDRLPPPRWREVPLGRYRRHTVAGQQRATAVMITARGCGCGCAYCCDGLMSGGRMRRRSNAAIIEEVDALRRHHDLGFIEFVDDNFVAGLGHKAPLLDHLRRAALPFSVNTRPELITEARARSLAQAGCASVFLGVEAADPDTLASLGRRGSAQEALAAGRAVRRAGMRLVASFMLGAPGETGASMERTVALALRLSPDKALFNIVQPHPGTALYRRCLSGGLIDEYEPDHGRYPGPPHGVPTVNGPISRQELQRVVARAHRRFYTSPCFLVRQLAACRTRADLARLAGLIRRTASARGC